MRTQDVDRWYVVREVMEGKLRQREAGRLLGKRTRQIRRLVARVRKEGQRGVMHGLKGRASARRTAAATVAAVQEAVARQYHDFGPALVQEMLGRREGIKLSVSTVRRLMIGAQQ